MKQRTVSRPVSLTGIGLHSGKKVSVTISPAPEDTGILFVRNGVQIRCVPENVTSTMLATCVEEGGEKVMTVEHLLSAISALMIDNLVIEVSREEVPILDGSSIMWMFLLENAGLRLQNKQKKFLRITKKTTVHDGDKMCSISPSDTTSYDISTKFNHPLIDQYTRLSYEYTGSNNFRTDISRARTFGFLKDLETLQANNLALGGSVENAIVCDEFGIVNGEGLRYADEFIRHKLLDAIGDMRMLGYNFIGSYTAHKPGHHLNNLLCREIITQGNYEIIESPVKSESEIRHYQTV